MVKLILGIFALCFIFCNGQAQFQESLAPLTIVSTDPISAIKIDLDFPGSYEINVKPSGDQPDAGTFCSALPPQIKSSVEWSGSIDFLRYHNFNNIQYFRNEYFIFDLESWRITVTANLSDINVHYYIECDVSVNYQKNGNNEIPFFIIDTDFEVIYIIRSDLMVSYQLSQFYDARKYQREIPKLKKIESNLKSYLNVKRAKYYKKHLFIVADNIVDVWNTEYKGTLVLDPPSFDQEFFNVKAVSISGIAFKDQYIFILDELFGIYVVNTTEDGRYENLGGLEQKVVGGKFIEIIGDSLSIVVTTKRQTTLYEYTIVSTPKLSLKLNRQLEIRDSVRSTASDSNFLYLITGFYNIVAKHSIPQTFDSAGLRTSYISYWPLSNINAILPSVNGPNNQLIILQNTKISIYKFEEGKALMTCDPQGISSDVYTYNIISKQKTCNTKDNAPTANSNDICEVSQQVSVHLSLKEAPNSENSKPLWIIGVIIGLLIVFGIWFSIRFFKKNPDIESPENRTNPMMGRRQSQTPLNEGEQTGFLKLGNTGLYENTEVSHKINIEDSNIKLVNEKKKSDISEISQSKGRFETLSRQPSLNEKDRSTNLVFAENEVKINKEY